MSPNHLLITRSSQHRNLLHNLLFVPQKHILATQPAPPPQTASSPQPLKSPYQTPHNRHIPARRPRPNAPNSIMHCLDPNPRPSQSTRVPVAFCAPRPTARPAVRHAGRHAAESRRSSPCSDRFDDHEQRQEPPGSAASSAPSPVRGSRRARARRWRAGSPIRASRH